MSHPKLKQLSTAEQLFDAGKLDEALELFNDWNQFEGLNFQQKHYFKFLKSLILTYQHKGEELNELGEQIFQEGQKFNEKLQSFDGLIFIITGLGLSNKFNEALKRIEQAETLLESFPSISEKELSIRKLRINVRKAWVNLFLGNIDLTEKYLKEPLSSHKELSITVETVWAHLLMAHLLILIKGNYELANQHTKKALSLAKQIKFNHYWIGFCNVSFGAINTAICEYDIALNYNMKSLAIFKEINNNWYIANLLNNIGYIYFNKGEYDLALKYMEEGLLLWEQYEDKTNILDSLIYVALQKGDIECAQRYFNRLEKIYNQKKDKNLEILYQYNKALMLKRSSRIRDKAKTEELLKHVIETENISLELKINSHIHLCDLLLAEYRINNNNEVLDEINHYTAQLLTIAEKSRAFLVFSETFILQAKLALLNFDVKSARRLLNQAQKIAETYGIKRLAKQISHEHDELIKKQNIWENLKASNVSLSERWKLAGLKEQMDNLVRKRRFEVPEISDEEPVLLLILSEGGTPLFSHSFIEEKSYESHLFGGFLTTIDYFIREIFSEGLDRAIFGEYTLLLKSTPPFFISYIFKGDSYHALQKLNYFIDHIQKQGDIWQNLLGYFKINQTVYLKDIPLLDSLITETFITKRAAFSEL